MSGVPYHAWTHRPKEEGGTDPIPGKEPWASVWDSFVWGQSIDDGTQGQDVRIKMTAGVISDNGGPYFDLVAEADTELGEDIYTPAVLKNGIYQFTLRVNQQFPGHPHFIMRYYFENQNDIEYPGKTAGAINWDIVHHADDTMGSWGAIHTLTATIPIRLDLPTAPWEPWPSMLVLEFAGGVGGFDGSVQFKNFTIVRLGDLQSTLSWPDDGVGA